MKIGIFAYNFKHKKTQEGLLRLFLEGYGLMCILAQDRLKLNIPESTIRISPKDITYLHPKKIAERLSVPYYAVEHNSKECEKVIRKYDLDLGIILGARILKKNIIDSFKIGILNMHPALLPENRGLDNIKWAILNGIKQGVSCHLINDKIDAGELILREPIRVYEDDTLLDIYLRIQSKELDLMVRSIKLLKSGCKTKKLRNGNYFRAMPPDKEIEVLNKFVDYKRHYEKN